MICVIFPTNIWSITMTMLYKKFTKKWKGKMMSFTSRHHHHRRHQLSLNYLLLYVSKLKAKKSYIWQWFSHFNWSSCDTIESKVVKKTKNKIIHNRSEWLPSPHLCSSQFFFHSFFSNFKYDTTQYNLILSR